MNEKNIWQKFNPTLAEMQEQNPKITILGLWWAWYWRIFVVGVAILASFMILGFLAAVIFYYI